MSGGGLCACVRPSVLCGCAWQLSVLILNLESRDESHESHESQ
jgi:hypothetical protein